MLYSQEKHLQILAVVSQMEKDVLCARTRSISQGVDCSGSLNATPAAIPSHSNAIRVSVVFAEYLCILYT